MLPEASLRWLQHHSALQQGDAVILGSVSVEQMEMNMNHWYVSVRASQKRSVTTDSFFSELGPLSEDVVKLFERAWLGVKAFAAHYAS